MRREVWIVVVLAAGLCGGANGSEAQGSGGADRAALEAFYRATGGADWTNDSNWLTWNDLTGEIPAFLERLGELTHLNLSANALTGDSRYGDGEIPTFLGSLDRLSHLDLSVMGLRISRRTRRSGGRLAWTAYRRAVVGADCRRGRAARRRTENPPRPFALAQNRRGGIRRGCLPGDRVAGRDTGSAAWATSIAWI